MIPNIMPQLANAIQEDRLREAEINRAYWSRQIASQVNVKKVGVRSGSIGCDWNSRRGVDCCFLVQVPLFHDVCSPNCI